MSAVRRGLAAFLLVAGCKGDAEGGVHIVNGFDFPVSVRAVGDAGEATLDVPARGRVTTDAVSGMGTYTVTKAGTTVAEGEAQWGKAEKSPGCLRLFNVEGAAAVAQEDIAYGTGFGNPSYSLRAGNISDQYCGISWAFKPPPEAITVDGHSPPGRNKTWLHYVDDGGWATSVRLLLDDTGQFSAQSRGKAQRIVRAVVAHDASNPALAEVKERFAKMNLKYPD